MLNGDDPLLRRAAESCRARIVWVGRGPDVDWQAEQVQSGRGRLRFRVAGQAYEVPVWGRHHLTSALCRDCRRTTLRLRSAKKSPRPWPVSSRWRMRCEVSQSGGATIVNDSYNSSPTAMRAALELLREIDSPGRRIVVAGDMGDLGETAAIWHRRLGEEVVNLCGADLLIACGQHASETATAATAAGHAPRPRDCVPRLGASSAGARRSDTERRCRAGQRGARHGNGTACRILAKRGRPPRRHEGSSSVVRCQLAREHWPQTTDNGQMTTDKQPIHLRLHRLRPVCGNLDATLPPGLEHKLVVAAVSGSTAAASASRWSL